MKYLRVAIVALASVALLGVGLAVGSSLAGNDPSATTTASEQSSDDTTVPTGADDGGSGETTDTPQATTASSCDFSPGEPFIQGESVTLAEIGTPDGVRVQAAVYPRPDYEGELWSQWGQGITLDDGRFVSAIGDHVGQDGNSFLYEYDPDTNALTMIGDVLSFVDHQAGSWGYGKIHAQMVEGTCGEIYFATYWGTRSDLRYDGSYTGDILFRLDPQTRTIGPLDVPVLEHGIPSLAASRDGTLVYGEATDPFPDVDEGPFFVYDTLADEVVFTGPDTPHALYRNMMVDAESRAYYSIGGGQLAVYDPQTNQISTHDAAMPGEALRASTSPAPDGRVFGVTDDEAALFALEPGGEITSLGTARGYTTSMALDPDGSRFFYVPDAHGGAWESGAPLISVDTETGEQAVIVELNEMAEANLGMRLGGTYSIAVDESGDRIFIGMNAAPLSIEGGFGEVVLVVVDLP